MTRFFQLTLRTLDVEAARAFYAGLLGEAALDVVKLHEQAVARGARPHWLGLLEVGDVDRAVAAFLARGASALGPKWTNPKGLEAAVLKDPGGAILALGRPPAGPAPGPLGPVVAWYGLNTADVPRARADYGALFGWHFFAPVDLQGLGVFHPFAWEPGGARVGAVTDIGTRPGVHPHWLFQFRVAALGPALDVVRAGGGTVVGPFTLPGGAQLAVCEDPQGAAFGLRHEPA